MTRGQQLCLKWAVDQDWDLVKGYAKAHGPEVLLGIFSEEKDKNSVAVVRSVLTVASHYENVEMVKLTLEAGFNNKEAMYSAAQNEE
jgi:hypothetical protein